MCDRCYIPDAALEVFSWLGYGNSALNPVIYAVSMRTFANTFRHMCHCWPYIFFNMHRSSCRMSANRCSMRRKSTATMRSSVWSRSESSPDIRQRLQPPTLHRPMHKSMCNGTAASWEQAQDGATSAVDNNSCNDMQQNRSPTVQRSPISPCATTGAVKNVFSRRTLVTEDSETVLACNTQNTGSAQNSPNSQREKLLQCSSSLNSSASSSPIMRTTLICRLRPTRHTNGPKSGNSPLIPDESCGCAQNGTNHVQPNSVVFTYPNDRKIDKRSKVPKFRRKHFPQTFVAGCGNYIGARLSTERMFHSNAANL